MPRDIISVVLLNETKEMVGLMLWHKVRPDQSPVERADCDRITQQSLSVEQRRYEAGAGDNVEL